MQSQPSVQDQEKFNKVIEQATTDGVYRRRLIANPRAVLAEAGIEVPEEVEVRVREYDENTRYIFLPPLRHSSSGW
jgi:hypothetical protein